MRKRYSERKNIRHSHFQKYYSGNPNDLDSALNAIPDLCSKESWKEIVDLFLSPKFIARSTQNKKNRKEMKYLSTQGSKSMAAIRNEYDEPDEHAIDAWKDTHIKKSTKTWVSETCKELHVS
ncbi:uncharacterized protein LOC133793485 [Humulus lupulus]|uniref:uncharacterized protein LOC133793485 n=1 Tax=Humulus lupulus TaxID=3486 RepID=UPI002B415C29|nr:uncharacterized protein LOC133793485 [Humulus lupulus]